MSDIEPRVWIGSLAAYNNGTLLGAWFDAIDAPTDSRDWAERMAKLGLLTLQEEALDRLAQEHEELWVMDHDGFGGALTAEGPPMEAQRIAEMLAEVDDDEREAFAAWLGEHRDGTVSDFRDAYGGTFESFKDYAYEYVDSIGLFDGVSSTIASYFDYDAFARDLKTDYDTYEVSGGVAVFHL